MIIRPEKVFAESQVLGLLIIWESFLLM